MKAIFIVAVAAFGIATATGFAMSTKAWADSPWWTSEDEMDEVVNGRIEYGPMRRSAGPSQIQDYIREQYNNSDSRYVTPWRSLADRYYDEQPLRRGSTNPDFNDYLREQHDRSLSGYLRDRHIRDRFPR